MTGHEQAAAAADPRYAAGIIDVFVYVVVLNIFVEYLPRVLSEIFTLTLLTAALLKAVLEVVVAAEHRIRGRIRAAASPLGKAAAAIMLWVVLFASKFAVLEIVALAFGDRVSLGGLVSVTALILALLLSRALVRRLLSSPR